MMLLYEPAPLAFALIGWLALAPALGLSLCGLRRNFLPTPASQHGWLAAIVTTALVWALHVRSPVGLDFGLLGSALFALTFGRDRAVVGLVLALLLHTALTSGSWLNVGLNGVLLAVLPAWLASAMQRAIERWLPRNIFVFIIGNGLFVTLFATALASVVMLGASAIGMPSAVRAMGDHLLYSLLLAWGEALLSGMLFSALVVFLPQVVLTYRQDLYLPPRRSL
jgi:uncharacterized membrane protein